MGNNKFKIKFKFSITQCVLLLVLRFLLNMQLINYFGKGPIVGICSKSMAAAWAWMTAV